MREDDRELVAAEAREDVRSDAAISRTAPHSSESTTSPITWPKLSLICLNSSMSKSSSDSGTLNVARALDLLRQLPAEVALVPDAGEVVGVGEIDDPLARADRVEEHRDLRREDRQDLLLAVVNGSPRGRGAAGRRRGGRCCEQRVRRVSAARARCRSRRQVVRLGLHDHLGRTRTTTGISFSSVRADPLDQRVADQRLARPSRVAT